jgi:amino acid transporter
MAAPSGRFGARVKRLLVGRPRDLFDKSIFHTLALVPVLAWVGLGADGLSSCAYGPEEAFKSLGAHHAYLGVALAVAVAGTVWLLAAAYSHLIEAFPTGGGYGVATRMLGRRVGLVSGCALLVDYVLTITISVAAAGKALFSLLPPEWSHFALACEIAALAFLTVINMRGAKESILVLLPIFAIFVLTHLIVIVTGIVRQVPHAPQVAQEIATGWSTGIAELGLVAILAKLATAYAMSGSTYTGLEAVSNGLPLLREPRIANAKRTMLYLAISLSLAAAGIITCYLLWDIRPVEGKTMNAVLAERVSEGLPGATALVWATMLSAGFLLIAAAQAGFLSGPRVMSNLAVDGWLPRSFQTLSDRLVTANAILFLGIAAGGALWYTKGDVSQLAVLYTINVFLTFSLTMIAMLRYWWQQKGQPRRWRRIILYLFASLVCGGILLSTVATQFDGLGQIALAVTGLLAAVCLLIHAHYQSVSARLRKLYMELENLPRTPKADVGLIDRTKPVAVILVSRYGGIGIHTVLNVFRAFPGHFQGVVFLSVGIVDSGRFKGEDSMTELRQESEDSLAKYEGLCRSLGLPCMSRYAVGLDVVVEAERLCLEVAKEFPRCTFFAGKVIFGSPKWYHGLLHNDAAMAIQRRLQLAGRTVVVIPARMT